MNLAKIHDRTFIKNIWEKRIDRHSQQSGSEDQRMEASALGKLRDEWSVRLENRTKHLKNLNVNETFLKKSKPPVQT